MALQSIKLSVVITTYNSAETILSVLNSICSAGIEEVEVIIVDDCSQDDTVEIIEKNFPKALVVVLAINSGGPARPRNKGIGLARGEYVLFCDSDDLILSSYIRRAISILDKGVFEIIGARRKVIRSYKEFDINKDIDISKVTTMTYRSMSLKDRMTFSGTIIKKSSVDLSFDESNNLVGLEDYLFFLEAIRSGVTAGRIENTAIGYLISNNNISRNKILRLRKFYTMNRVHGRRKFSSIFYTFSHYFVATFEKAFKIYF